MEVGNAPPFEPGRAPAESLFAASGGAAPAPIEMLGKDAGPAVAPLVVPPHAEAPPPPAGIAFDAILDFPRYDEWAVGGMEPPGTAAQPPLGLGLDTLPPFDGGRSRSVSLSAELLPALGRPVHGTRRRSSWGDIMVSYPSPPPAAAQLGLTDPPQDVGDAAPRQRSRSMNGGGGGAVSRRERAAHLSRSQEYLLAPPARKPMAPAPGGFVCSCCGSTSTPLWREGKNSIKLCNACGIRWVKYGISCEKCFYVPRKGEGAGLCARCGEQFPRAWPLVLRRRSTAGSSDGGGGGGGGVCG